MILTLKGASIQNMQFQTMTNTTHMMAQPFCHFQDLSPPQMQTLMTNMMILKKQNQALLKNLGLQALAEEVGILLAATIQVLSPPRLSGKS